MNVKRVRRSERVSITIPASFLQKFKAYDAILEILKRTGLNSGLSLVDIGRLFSTVTKPSPWGDPAFLVWAGRQGCTRYEHLRDLCFPAPAARRRKARTVATLPAPERAQ